ncbi:MAG: signal peptidase I [Ktedonobacteraceae bacterium]
MKPAASTQFRFVREMIETIVLTVLLFFVISSAVQNYFVDGVSMEPNLHNTERILVDKWSYLFHPPQRGDIIVFVAPPDPSADYVKRIIALPGDIITIRNTTVIVDGDTLNETYIAPSRQGNPFAYKQLSNIIVPSNDYFVLGDNRAQSSDSRDWGFVPRNNIVGRAVLVYWPLGESNDGLLPNVSRVFANVHQTGVAPSAATDIRSIDTNSFFFVLTPSLFLISIWRRKRPGKSLRREKIRSENIDM